MKFKQEREVFNALSSEALKKIIFDAKITKKQYVSTINAMKMLGFENLAMEYSNKRYNDITEANNYGPDDFDELYYIKFFIDGIESETLRKMFKDNVKEYYL